MAVDKITVLSVVNVEEVLKGSLILAAVSLLCFYIFEHITKKKAEKKSIKDFDTDELDIKADKSNMEKAEEEIIEEDNSALKDEHLDYFRKRLYTKVDELFSEVVSGKAKLATYYTLDDDKTEKEAWFTVERVSEDIIYVNIEKDYMLDYYKINSSYDEEYVYLKLDIDRRTADVMSISNDCWVIDSSFDSSKGYTDRTPRSLYEQNNYNDRADVFFGRFLRDGLYLKEYLTEDGTKVYGRNQPVLKPKIEEHIKVKDNESGLAEKTEDE